MAIRNNESKVFSFKFKTLSIRSIALFFLHKVLTNRHCVVLSGSLPPTRGEWTRSRKLFSLVHTVYHRTAKTVRVSRV